MPINWEFATIGQIGGALRSNELTSVQLVEELIERADRLDPVVGAFMTRFDDTARRAAQQADEELARGIDRGPLHGVPVGVKDLLWTVEGPTTGQSAAIDPAWFEHSDGEVIRRLRAAGAVITGKLTLNEFGCGEYGGSEDFPLPTNPWDPSRWPGGSSAGAGARLAAGLFPAAIGTDTGGSIRIPSAMCGTSGLKPTFGLVPVSGVVPMAASFDHVGPMARTMADCAAILAVIADRPFTVAAEIESLVGLRIGVVREHHFPDTADADLAARFDDAVAVFAATGAEVVEVSLPHYREALGAFSILELGELLDFHARNLRQRWSEYTAGARLLMAQGAFASASEYVRVQRVRDAVNSKIAALFAQVDVIATPTTAVAAYRFEEMAAIDPDMLLGQLFTQYWNLTGNPAASVPMGPASTGMPLGLQLIGAMGADETVLRVGHAFQQRTTWHDLHPALSTEEGR